MQKHFFRILAHLSWKMILLTTAGSIKKYFEPVKLLKIKILSVSKRMVFLRIVVYVDLIYIIIFFSQYSQIWSNPFYQS